MAAQFKDDPLLWEKFYHDQNTKQLGQAGFPRLNSTQIVLTDKPTELRDLQEKIEAGWKEYQSGRVGAQNEKLYAMAGRDSLEYDRDTLIVRAYETDYATSLIKLGNKEGLTAEEIAFLDARVMFLGASGLIQCEDKYLVGKIAAKNIKEGLWESVPQGWVSHGFHRLDDPFRKTIEKELQEETHIEKKDTYNITPWGLNLGPRAGNCTLIYRLRLDSASRRNIRCSSEHQELRWATSAEILDASQKYAWSPVTVRLFEKVEENIEYKTV